MTSTSEPQPPTHTPIPPSPSPQAVDAQHTTTTSAPAAPESEPYKRSYNYVLAASTGETYNGSIDESNARELRGRVVDGGLDIGAGTGGVDQGDLAQYLQPRKPPRRRWENGAESNCFRSVQWTGDGKYLVTNSEDSAVRVFELPTDWADEEVSPLKPISVVYAPESVYSIGVCPWILEDPTLNWFLTCTRDNPIHLYSLDGSLLQSYIIQHASTEKFLSPHSLAFAHTTRQFICGTDSMLSIFDFHRREPILTLRTIPSRNSRKSTSTMKGIISAMDVSLDRGILAAGTFSRQVGLYDQEGSGEVVSIFSLDTDKMGNRTSSVGGVTDVKWSGCGTYLYVAERKDSKITVWDVRRLFSKVATLTGREARSVQRIGIDVLPTGGGGGEGDGVIGGGLDGKVKVWDVNLDNEPVAEWQAHTDRVTSVAVNPAWPGLIATCSGQRNHSRGEGSLDLDSEEGPRTQDNSLKLWRYGGPYGDGDGVVEEVGRDPSPRSRDDGENAEREEVPETSKCATIDLVVDSKPGTASM
ncbi:WD40-repeat-containing domain protein [Peziza echinospora]|nr:WD40-repeat-containing domain protein [Peziza echinospora]